MRVPEAITRRAAKAVPWAIAESVACVALGAISIILMARLLDPRAFGTVALVVALVSFVEFCITAPFSESLVQRPSLQALHVDSAFWAMTGFGLLSCVCCVLLSGPISELYSDPAIRDLIRVSSLSLLMAGLNGLPTIMLQRRLKVRALAKRGIAGHAASVATAVILAILGFGVWSIVFGDLVGKAVVTIVLWRSYPRRPRLRFSHTHLFDLLRFGANTALEWFLWVFALRTFVAVIGYFHGPTALGYLHLATRVTDTMLQFLRGVSNRFYLPVFSALQDDESRLRLLVVQASRINVAVSAPTFLGLAAIAPIAVEVVLGARWLPAVPLIQILCIFWALETAVSAVGPYLKAIGKPSTVIFPALAATIVSLVVALAAVDLSAEEAQAGFGLRVLVIAPLLLYFARTLGGLSVRRFLSSISVPCVSAVLMALGVWALEAALPTSHSWRQLIACVVAGILIYATTLYALDKQTSYLFQRVARRALGRRT